MKPLSALASPPLRAMYTVEQASVRLSAQRPVRAQRMIVEGDVRPHDHAYHEICVVLAGNGNALHRTATFTAPMLPGTVLVVPPGHVHAMDGTGGFTVVNLYYLAEWLMADLGQLWAEHGLVHLFLAGALFKTAGQAVAQFQLTQDELSIVSRELADLEREWNSPDPSALLLCAGFLKTLTLLARAWSREPTPALFSAKQPVWKTMQAIERLVAQNDPLDVSALADELDVSPGHLAKMFRAAVGHGVTDYYQRRRIHRACQRLLDPRPSVTSVAYELGYADTPHLCRMFKRYRGMTPRQYRKIYVGGPARTPGA